MGWTGWVRRRFDVLANKDEVERELDEEVRFHLEMEIRQHMASGLDPQEARRRAMVDFGGVERFKEEVRDVRGVRLLDDLVQDTKVAVRSLPRQPAFLLSVLATLAIGIGGSVAMFGVLDATLLQSLPYPEADRLVLARTSFDGRLNRTSSGPDYFDYREQVEGFAGFGATTPFPVQTTVTGVGDPERVDAPLVSHNLFTVLGVDPLIGRHFRPEEGEPGAAAVVMLSHDYWQRAFGGAPDAVGRTLNVGGRPTTIVGVMPAGFRFLTDADMWEPMIRDGRYASARQFHNWALVGRLAPGAGLAAVQAEVDGVAERLAEAYPDSNENKGLHLTPLQDALVEGYRTTLLLLSAAVVVLLLVAGSNVAGLLVARGAARRSEMALRSVMGAGRGRLARQLVTENALLSGAAAALGIGLAIWLQGGLLGFLPLQALGPVEAAISGRMVGAAVGFGALTVLVFGLLPSMRVAATDPAGDLRSGTRTAGSRASTRLRSVLVVSQVGLTAVLLVVSGLLLRSFAAINSVDPGFRTERLLTSRVGLPAAEYDDPVGRTTFFDQLAQRLGAEPGIEAVGLTSHVPIRDTGGNVRVASPEEWGGGGVFGRTAYQRVVMPGTFAALGIPLVAGRDLQMTDDADSAPVVVLSESLAAEIYPDGPALGRPVAVDVGRDTPARFEVVGVVGDVTPSRLDAGQDFVMYLAYPQRTPASMSLAVRTTTEGTAVTTTLRSVLRELDPDVPLADVATMDEVLADSVAGRRSVMVLIGGFAAIALILASVGLYGVLAYQVSRRMHEIGVRMALGATTGGVSQGIVREGLILVGIGLAIGVPGALAASRLVQGMLFEVGGTDPVTYAAVALFLGAIGALACLVPAHRAARVDPVTAFRAE